MKGTIDKTLTANVVASLDKVADHLERNGMKNAAKELDRVANTLQSPKVIIATVPDTEPGNPADEAARLDGFTAQADEMHKFPVGSNNVGGEVFDKRNAADYEPAFASEEPVTIQASKKTASDNVDLEDLAERGLDPNLYDVGDGADDFSTGGLPETGGDPTLDGNQEGSDIPAFGTRPEGTLRASVIKHANQLKNLVAHRQLTVGEAREILAHRIVALGGNAPTEVVGAEELDKDEGFATASTTTPDQFRSAAVKILKACPPPTNVVPRQALPMWFQALKTAKKHGKLVTANKRFNQPAVLAIYRNLMASLATHNG